jgi:hypothetical protein
VGIRSFRHHNSEVAMKKFLLLLLLVGCGTVQVDEPLSEERLAAVRNGMSAQEVERLLGQPDGGTATYGSGETVSGWRVPVRGRGVWAAYFNVHYRDGRVVRTSRSFDYLSG